MDKNIIEIPVKAMLLGEFKDFQSWIKNLDAFMNQNGIMHKILHIDCNGFCTNGYDLKNTKRDSPYPVKSYVLIADNDVIKPFTFKEIEV